MPPYAAPNWACWNRDKSVDTALEVRKNGKARERLLIAGKDFFTMGRGSQKIHVDHRLDHPSISRQHVAFVHDKHGQLHVTDLGSTHGTFLNGKKLQPNK